MKFFIYFSPRRLTRYLTINFPSYSIGYTTPASNARSSLYSSDVGKMINAPVLHVNGDYPEGIVSSAQASCVLNADNPQKTLQERWILRLGIGIISGR